MLADRYAITNEVGAGGMATVYHAEDLRHGRSVALKVLRPEVASAIGAERFLREIQIAAQLTHSHILPLHDSGEADGLLYFVMPYVEGESLRQRLQREGQLPLEDALRLAREIADALQYAHSRGFVHRDIKPENVLLGAGHALVGDFGIARAISLAGGTTLTETGIAVGTPAYMSPEQASGERDIDGRADVYALGCVLYEMVAGHPPFGGLTPLEILARHTLDPVPPLGTARPGVPRAVELAVHKALAKNPADRFATATAFATALSATPSRGIRPGVGVRLAAAVMVTAAVASVLVLRGRGPDSLDVNLVAVTPFNVLAPGHELWREGLMDILSRNLDGAGPLRTVAPSLMVRRWSGRADRPSAASVARRVGARWAAFGSLVAAGSDSVRLHAVLVDAASDEAIAEVEARDEVNRVDRAADTVTVALLRVLASRGPIGVARLGSFGTQSVPALKTFLEGEQMIRRGAWDSALSYHRRALELDSTFALALRRVYLASWWRADEVAYEYALKAGALNRGLAARESLLVAGDSLFAAVALRGPDTPVWVLTQRLHTTLEEAARRYPDDPEVWYQLGEARMHYGLRADRGPPVRELLATFDRALELDSAYVPALLAHTIDLALFLDDSVRANRYITSYLRLKLQGRATEPVRIVARLLAAADPHSSDVDQLLASTRPTDLMETASYLSYWPDSAERAIRVARAWSERRDAPDSTASRALLAWLLAYRGHLRAALALAPDIRYLTAELALLGGLEPDSASALFNRWLREEPGWVTGKGLRWWSAQRDTTSIHRFLGQRLEGSRGRYYSAVASAHLALARGDTAGALTRFLAADSLCPDCDTERLLVGRLLAARGGLRDAARWLDREIAPFSSWPLHEPQWALERGRVNERLGERAKAIAAYRFVARAWMHADSVLQPYVAEAHAAIRRLGGDRR